MNKQKLVELLKEPGTIDQGNLAEVGDLVTKYPYFQSGHALLAAGNQIHNPSGSKQFLTTAAIYATNRALLKKYLGDARGGAQTSDPEDAKVSAKKTITAEPKQDEKPVTKKEEPVDKEEKESIPDKSIPDKKEEKAEKPKLRETMSLSEERERIRIRRRREREAEIAKEEKQAQEEEPKAKAEEIPQIPQRDDNLDIEKLLSELKDGYSQLQTNIQSFDQAEKNLTKAEKEEAAQAKTPAKKPAAKAAASKTKETKAPAKKKAAKSTTKAATTAKKVTKKPAAKKTTPKASSKTTTPKAEEKPPANRKVDLNAISDDDDDLLTGDDDQSKKKEQKILIDKFIEEEPKLTPQKEQPQEKEPPEDLSSKNQVLTDDMVTENLALIMTKQGRVEKAMEIYNKLIWKFPHKKAYFAARIEDLKEQ
ncbi:MAG: hypothetical protein RJQ09_02555 [Cyclobacteriaceae bacterium]